MSNETQDANDYHKAILDRFLAERAKQGKNIPHGFEMIKFHLETQKMIGEKMPEIQKNMIIDAKSIIMFLSVICDEITEIKKSISKQ